MNEIDWPDLVAGAGILESLDAAGMDCCVPGGMAPQAEGGGGD